MSAPVDARAFPSLFERQGSRHPPLATLVASGMSSLLARHLGAARFDEARAVFAGAHGLALATSAGLFGELGYGTDVGQAHFEPFANLALIRHAIDGFTEEGGAAALRGEEDVTDATFTTLGLRASTKLPMGEAAKARLTGMAGWRHAFADVPTSTHTFVAGGDTFTVPAAGTSSQSAC